jgi:hypothetical protein
VPKTETTAGYAHGLYAESLSEFGTPRELSRSRGWILERSIHGFSDRDALGCYPLFACRDWSALEADLNDIKNELVSLSLVADPFGDYDRAHLERCFKNVVVPFKEHFVADLSRPERELISKHHRYYAQKAMTSVHVERCFEPSRYLDEWVELYANLTARHALKGIKAFSKNAFAGQMHVPGLVMLRATHEGAAVGAHLWFVQGDVAYSHLAAVSARGYDLMASYALYRFAIESFAGEVRWLNFGAGAGVGSDATDGLTRFKRGWSSETRTAYFCGRIFDRQRYNEILAAKALTDGGNYFPAYRQGEFG